MGLGALGADPGGEPASGLSPPGYAVNSATVPGGDVLYIAGQPRYNHTGQVIIYRMEGGDVRILQTLRGEQVSREVMAVKSPVHTLGRFHFTACCPQLQKHRSLIVHLR